MKLYNVVALVLLVAGLSCKSKQAVDPPESFFYRAVQVDGKSSANQSFRDVGLSPVIKLSFSAPLQKDAVPAAVKLTQKANAQAVPLTYTLSGNDTTLTLTPQKPLSPLTAYTVEVAPTLPSQRNTALNSTITVSFVTALDSTDKFPHISDDALLDLVQKQTFKYFWDFGHPVSGMARERNSSGDVVTSGGTGFGIMAIVVAVNRQFISRQDGLTGC